MSTNIFDRISFWSLFLVITLLPVFFLPFTNIPVETSKGLLLVIGLAVSVVSWAIARFSDGEIVIPRSPLLLSGLGIVLAFLLSAVFSKSGNVSMFGTMFDVGTVWFMFACFLLMLSCSIAFRDSKNAGLLLIGMVFSFALVMVFQAAHIFVPKLSLGVFIGKTDNMIGFWNAFGFFAGLCTLVSVFIFEFFSTSRAIKVVLGFLIALGLLLVTAVNLPLIWMLLGIFSLIVFVYKASLVAPAEAEDDKKKAAFPISALAVLVISLLFFISGSFLGGFLASRLGLANTEVSPTLKATALVATGAIKHNPAFGMGPNRFTEAWSLYKPAAVNNTQFWDVSFSSGSGLLPTFAVTTGILGIVAWLLFFGLFILAGVRSIFSGIRKGLNFRVLAFFIMSLYLFITAFFYFEGFVLFVLAFACTGAFIGLSSGTKENGRISMPFLTDHRKSFFSMLLLIGIVVLASAGALKYGERLASVSYFRKAIAAQTVPEAESAIGKAVALYQNDLYLRTFSDIYLIKLGALAQKDQKDLSDADKADIKASFDQAINSAQLAVAYNSKNYLNYQELGSIYQNFATFGVKEATPKAVEAYTTASSLNPQNPRLKLALTGAAFADGKLEDAKKYAAEALALKPNYTDALVALSQLARNDKDDAKALSYAEQALAIDPSNKDLAAYVTALKNSSSTPTPPKTTTDTTPKTP